MMNKKFYVAPLAELMSFAPIDDIAVNWKWDLNPYSTETASVTGNVSIFQDAEESWQYGGAKKPY